MRSFLIRFQFPNLPNVHCAFHGRDLENGDDPLAGNISFLQGQDPAKVAAARESLEANLGAESPLQWRECKQVHGDKIIKDPCKLSYAEAPEADGMMSEQPACALMIKTADCQPILFADKSGKYIMAIHAGWRGNRMNFPGKAVKAFCTAYGLASKDVYAVRGPSLGPAKAEFINFAAEWGADFAPWYNKANKCMDLWKLTQRQLIDAGVPENQIYGIDICTAANYDLFFSYRMDHKCGRQASLIWME